MKSMVKVGVFATLCLVVLAVLVWKIEDLNPFAVKGQRVDAVFQSVAGLDDKASVRIAGVSVGRVDGVGLDGTRARITIALDKPLGLTQGTTARIANLGLLGEKYVELVPGPANAPPLPPGAVLVGTTPPGFDEAMQKINDIGSSIQEITGSLSGGNMGGNFNRLLDDIRLTSAEIRALVAENRANVGSAIQNFDQVGSVLARELPRLADQMNRALDQISAVVAENRGDLRGSMGNIRELSEKLQTSADNLNKITDKIASGQGTIGKLVNDDKAYNELISTLDSIKGGVEIAERHPGRGQQVQDRPRHAGLLPGEPRGVAVQLQAQHRSPGRQAPLPGGDRQQPLRQAPREDGDGHRHRSGRHPGDHDHDQADPGQVLQRHGPLRLQGARRRAPLRRPHRGHRRRRGGLPPAHPGPQAPAVRGSLRLQPPERPLPTGCA